MCQLHPWRFAPHTALLSSQNSQWQLCDAVTAAAALPKKGCGLCSEWPGMPIGERILEITQSIPILQMIKPRKSKNFQDHKEG